MCIAIMMHVKGLIARNILVAAPAYDEKLLV